MRRIAVWETTKNCWILILLSIPVLAFLVSKILQTNFAHATREDGTTIDPNIAAVSLFGINLNYVSLEWIAIFSSVWVFGALGATTSFFSRAENVAKGNRTIAGTQVFGAIFSTVLTLLFIGGLVQGSLFPTFGDSGLRWIALRFSVEDWAKLLVWSFIAGFSERLVPEILNNLSARVRTSEAGFAEAAEPKGNAIKRVVVD